MGGGAPLLVRIDASCMESPASLRAEPPSAGHRVRSEGLTRPDWQPAGLAFRPDPPVEA